MIPRIIKSFEAGLIVFHQTDIHQEHLVVIAGQRINLLQRINQGKLAVLFSHHAYSGFPWPHVTQGFGEQSLQCDRRVAEGKFPTPNGNPVSPPELAAHRPIPLFFQPIQVGFGKTVGMECDFALVGGIDCSLHKTGFFMLFRSTTSHEHTLFPVAHKDEPLVGEIGLDRGFRTVRMTDLDITVFHPG